MIFIRKQSTLLIDEDIRKEIIDSLKKAGCIFAEEEAQLYLSEAKNFDILYAMINDRISGKPLEYILGWTEFCGVRISVSSGVFVPRRKTELLVQKAIELTNPEAKVLDICCGTGAIGVALANALGRIELYAVDIDHAAVQCAIKNVNMVGGQVYEGDLFEPLPENLLENVDIIVANAPYVPTSAIKLLPQDAREHEPKVALDGGVDGLSIQRKIVENAFLWLSFGGYLLVETSKMQAPFTIDLFKKNGLIPEVSYSEELDATVVIGKKMTKIFYR